MALTMVGVRTDRWEPVSDRCYQGSTFMAPTIVRAIREAPSEHQTWQQDNRCPIGAIRESLLCPRQGYWSAGRYLSLADFLFLFLSISTTTTTHPPPPLHSHHTATASSSW